MMVAKGNFISPIKVIIWCFSLGYILYLLGGIFFDYLGANPIEVITHESGEWGLHFLLASLSISPLRRHFHWNHLLKLRRLLGLWSFAFIFLHFSIFIFFDHFFYWASIVDDIIQRPYITVGFVAFVLMLPLALTSTRRAQQTLGKHWVRLHWAVYPIAILGLVHYWWLVKADTLPPLIYSIIVLLLLGDRLYWRLQKKSHHTK